MKTQIHYEVEGLVNGGSWRFITRRYDNLSDAKKVLEDYKSFIEREPTVTLWKEFRIVEVTVNRKPLE